MIGNIRESRSVLQNTPKVRNIYGHADRKYKGRLGRFEAHPKVPHVCDHANMVTMTVLKNLPRANGGGGGRD